MGRMADVTMDGTRLEQLRSLALSIAEELDAPDEKTNYAALSKQYRETISDIAYLEGQQGGEDELDKLLDG